MGRHRMGRRRQHVEPPAVEVDITDPSPLAVLYDHHGNEAWTLYDKRPIPFGYQSNG